jgi:DNA repair photolyase
MRSTTDQNPLPIFQPNTTSAGTLVGIARLAASAEQIREGHNVEYRSLPVRSILNRCTADYMPFTWTINPYRGCEFACKYCYARYTHEFMELRDGVEFERKIYIKEHTAHLLRQELRRVKPGEDIAIGTATDPYQPAERRYEMTRAIMEELSLHRGLEIGVVTKSQLVTRDIDLFKKISARNALAIHLTVTTVDAQLARRLEPRAPRPDLRLDAVKQLSAAGITTGVICAPILPGITDSPARLNAVVRAAKQAGASYVFANTLFLKPCSAAVFFPFLEENFPELVPAYRERYRDNAYVSREYKRKILDLVNRLCRKHGLPDRDERQRVRELGARMAQSQTEQLSLFRAG